MEPSRRFVAVAITYAVLAASCSDSGAPPTTTSGPGISSNPPATTVTSAPPGTTVPSTTELPPEFLDPPVFDRWTTILASLPVEDFSEEDATARAAELTDVGVGILLSADYPSLNAGYWVIFSGDFATQDEAVDRCISLRERDLSCYQRYLGDIPTVVAARGEGTAVAWVDGVLSLVSTVDGTTTPINDSFQGGLFPGALELTPDGTAAYFGLGFEDAWFSCEASAGQIHRADLTTGQTRIIAAGFLPRLSPDGTRLAYIAATHCVPDPDNELFVVSFGDAVQVLDLESGAVQTWGPSPGLAETDASLVSSLAWDADGGDIVVAMDDGTLRSLDTATGATLDTLTTLGPGRTPGLFGAWVLSGVRVDNGRMVTVEWDFQTATSTVLELSLTTGEIVSSGDTIDGFAVAKLDHSRTNVLVTSDGVMVGAPGGDFGPQPYFEGADW